LRTVCNGHRPFKGRLVSPFRLRADVAVTKRASRRGLTARDLDIKLFGDLDSAKFLAITAPDLPAVEGHSRMLIHSG
jgi:hypothetical protein